MNSGSAYLFKSVNDKVLILDHCFIHYNPSKLSLSSNIFGKINLL